MGHSCRKLLWDTLVGHFCGTLLWDALVGHSCGTLFWDTLVGHSCRKLLWDTLVGVKSPKQAFRVRLPPQVTREFSKTSLSYDTSSKTHTSSLHNERFVRDFLKTNTLPSTTIAISAETCHENRASMPHPETQIPMARPHPTPQKHDSPNANPNGTATSNTPKHDSPNANPNGTGMISTRSEHTPIHQNRHFS